MGWAPGTGPCSAAVALGTPELLGQHKARPREAKPALSPGVPCPQHFLWVSPVPSTGPMFLFSAGKSSWHLFQNISVSKNGVSVEKQRLEWLGGAAHPAGQLGWALGFSSSSQPGRWQRKPKIIPVLTGNWGGISRHRHSWELRKAPGSTFPNPKLFPGLCPFPGDGIPFLLRRGGRARASCDPRNPGRSQTLPCWGCHFQHGNKTSISQPLKNGIC